MSCVDFQACFHTFQHSTLHVLHSEATTQIEGLEGCMNLACLYLYENKIREIVNLDFALNLTHLYIQDNQIAVMENLESLPNLRKLFIGGNAITEIRGLENCNQLQELHVQAQRLPEGQPLLFAESSIDAISQSLLVLNTQKNNITQPSQFRILANLERLDLSMNKITSFEEVGALFADGCCMNMGVLETKGNPVSKQHKFRDYVVIMSPTLYLLDGKEITQTERQFLVNREAAKARARRHHDGMDMMAPQHPGHGLGGVEGQLLMESMGDHDPVAERARARPHIDQVPHKGSSAIAEREVYTGGSEPYRNREEDKERLQQHMQYNGDVPVPQPRAESQPQGEEQPQEEFGRVVKEIEERREFLEDMRAAGRGGEYDAMIKAQIAEKVQELEVIDQKIAQDSVAPPAE
mmetsp:Transcript_7080/g.11147  ORF Transcript_7080/g.11147 Transcript_7080/m.11147 type:complete len:408 (-) Transcript_7080:218-1441(-)